MNTSSMVFEIAELSQVGQVRRAVTGLAERLGWSPTLTGSVAIIVTELATNQVNYARDGQLLLRGCPRSGIDVIAIDRGPGLDVVQAMRDGFSTGGTAGNGLGAVQRLARDFDIYSQPGAGTIVFARVGGTDAEGTAFGAAEFVQCGAVAIAAPGETVCGDAWDIALSDNDLRVVLVDGLGHGPEASTASQKAIEVFRQQRWNDPRMLIEIAHTQLSDTRGAAIAAGQLSLPGNRFLYAGIGNISATLMSHQDRHGLMSHNGTVGAQMRSVHQLEYNWLENWTLVMHSDGISSRWDLDSYPGLLACHPAVVAAVLARDFSRNRDDVTAVVIRRRMGG